ncbi:alpha/beta fold hydrolase [Ahrensia sp. R2A130]|uniref:alpha/beta fold hydrolase n=1 Tax=Ahrensia sp. R2A130 TaxID=744979 RepID=UPI0001E0A4B2|nr:alpha/beta hydrolase [Ahrensia sp. R2A130]EFL88404.1 hydrolase, alpha [Ahrensia sp. R2A130]
MRGVKMWLWIVATLVMIAIIAAATWAWTPDRSRAELEAKYLSDPADMIEIAGTRLHLRDSGAAKSGRTVILLHGLGSHLQTWDGWANILDDEFRVVCFDFPGAALSPPDSTGRYDDERASELLLGIMDHLGVENASIIGNSVGGRIAWKFASQHGERVEKLVLISPDGYASPGFAYGKPPEVPFIMSAMKYALPKSMLRTNLEIAYGDETRLSDATMDRYHDLMLAPGNRQALLDRMKQTVLQNPEPFLKKITAPVLLLWGEEDRMIPVTNAQDYLAVLPDARLVTLPDLGHVPFEEAPTESIKPVLDFLQ